MDNMEETLKMIAATLKTIDVRGFESMDRLVGCVITLNKIIEEMELKRMEDKENG